MTCTSDEMLGKATHHVSVTPMGAYPGDNGRVALVLIDENLKLSLELGLLVGVRRAAVRVRRHAGHVLNDEQANLVTSLVEQIGLDFDLSEEKLASVIVGGPNGRAV